MKHKYLIAISIFLLVSGYAKSQDSLLYVVQKSGSLLIKKHQAIDYIASKKYADYIYSKNITETNFLDISYTKVNETLREVFSPERLEQVRKESFYVRILINGKGQPLQVDFITSKPGGNTQIRPNEFLLLHKKLMENIVVTVTVPAFREYEMLPGYNFPLFKNFQ